MHHLFLRGARRAAPLAVVLAAVTIGGCSGSSRSGAPSVSAPASPGSSTPGSAGVKVLSAARAKLAAEKSYRFDATEVVWVRTPVTTRLTGAVVRGQGLSYTLTVGKAHTQVIRLASATYVRTVPGRWSRRRKPSSLTDPTRSLAAVLAGLTAPQLQADSSGHIITGTLPSTAAKAAGIPANATGAQIAVTVNNADQVLLVTVRTATTAGARTVPVTLTTHYSSFDHVPPLRRPA